MTTPLTSDIILKIHERLSFLLDRQPKLEKIIVIFEDLLKDKASAELSIKDIFQYYEIISHNYNLSLELLRKILVYFPTPQTQEERELLQIYSTLPNGKRKRLREFIREISTTDSSSKN